jgi:protein-tyrosine-phosphatase
MNVLFICHANAIRSQIAEAFYNQMSTTGKAVSAGIHLTNSVQGDDTGILPLVVDLMKQRGIDVTHQRRDWLTLDMLKKADLAVVLTDKVMPEYLKEAKEVLFWSDIPDIVSSSAKTKEAVIDEIKRRVEEIARIR